jgi:hypothetical protein
LVKGIDTAINDEEMKWSMDLSEINRREKEFHKAEKIKQQFFF